MSQKKAYPRPFIQTSVAVLECLTYAAIAFGYRGPWTIQTFLLTPACSPEANISANCCASCLGLSPFEYGLSNAFPSWLVIVLLCAYGPLVDLCGLQLGTAITGLSAVSGLLSIAAAPHATSISQSLVLLCYFLGRCLLEAALYTCLAQMHFAVIHFFPAKWQALVFGLQNGLATCSSVAAGFVMPRLVLRFGLSRAFWIGTGSGAVAMIASLGLCALTSRTEVEQLTAGPSEAKQTFWTIIKSLKSLTVEFWLVATAFGLICALATTSVANTPMLQKLLFDISEVAAAANVAFGWMAQAGVTIALGLFLFLLPLHLAVAFLAIAFNAAAYVLLLVPDSPPLLASLLLGCVHPMGLMGLKPLVGRFVATAELGLATSVMAASEALAFGLSSVVLGALLNNARARAGVQRAVWVTLGLLLLPTAVLLALVIRKRWFARGQPLETEVVWKEEKEAFSLEAV